MYTDIQLDAQFDAFNALDDKLTDISYDRELTEGERRDVVGLLYDWRDRLLDAHEECLSSRMAGRIATLGQMVCQLLDEIEK